MTIRKMKYDELVRWHSDMLHSTTDGRVAMAIITLFGGDRLTCCDEAMCVEEDGHVVSLASIAPQGEMSGGTPTIVGLFTLPAYRRKGYGLAAMTAAIQRCLVPLPRSF